MFLSIHQYCEISHWRNTEILQVSATESRCFFWQFIALLGNIFRNRLDLAYSRVTGHSSDPELIWTEHQSINFNDLRNTYIVLEILVLSPNNRCGARVNSIMTQ